MSALLPLGPRERVSHVLRAVFFDLDDTLVDHESAANVAVLAWAAEHRIHDAEVAQRWRTISSTVPIRQCQRQPRRCSFRWLSQRCEASWTLFDDALPALRRARSAGLEVAVLTNGDEDHQRQKLSMLGLVDEVDTLISTSELPAAKPDSGRSVARWNG